MSLAESLGLDVTYLTDIDLQRTAPNPLLAHKAVISPGHDEYYSLAMRQALEQARDQGVNLAFLGANAVFRHIRFDASPLGADRREIDYKSASEDPLAGKDDADVTVNWRDPPNNNPESQLIGNFYQCNPVRADMVVVDPDNWLFQGTGATVGQKLPGRRWGRSTTATTRPCPGRPTWRSSPTPRCDAAARRTSPTPRTTAPRAGPGSSRPGPSIGSATWTSTAGPTGAPGRSWAG